MPQIKQTNLTNFNKMIKYVVMGLIMGIILRYVPTHLINNNEIIMISMLSSITLAILDMISPSIKIEELKTTEGFKSVIFEA